MQAEDTLDLRLKMNERVDPKKLKPASYYQEEELLPPDNVMTERIDIDQITKMPYGLGFDKIIKTQRDFEIHNQSQTQIDEVMKKYDIKDRSIFQKNPQQDENFDQALKKKMEQTEDPQKALRIIKYSIDSKIPYAITSTWERMKWVHSVDKTIKVAFHQHIFQLMDPESLKQYALKIKMQRDREILRKFSQWQKKLKEKQKGQNIDTSEYKISQYDKNFTNETKLLNSQLAELNEVGSKFGTKILNQDQLEKQAEEILATLPQQILQKLEKSGALISDYFTPRYLNVKTEDLPSDFVYNMEGLRETLVPEFLTEIDPRRKPEHYKALKDVKVKIWKKEKELKKNEVFEIQVLHSLRDDPYYQHHLQNHFRIWAEKKTTLQEGLYVYPESEIEFLEKDNIEDFKVDLGYKENLNDPGYGRGWRKSAKCQAWLTKGCGKITINGLPINVYFYKFWLRDQLLQPLRAAGVYADYDIKCIVRGSGLSSQSSACRLAIARAVQGLHPEVKQMFTDNNLNRTDPRVVERKKVGKYKARKKEPYQRR